MFVLEVLNFDVGELWVIFEFLVELWFEVEGWCVYWVGIM